MLNFLCSCLSLKSSHENCDDVISSDHRAGTQAAVGANTGAHTYFGKFFQLSVQFICGGENNTDLADICF